MDCLEWEGNWRLPLDDLKEWMMMAMATGLDCRNLESIEYSNSDRYIIT
jgi:hypothetical protein